MADKIYLRPAGFVDAPFGLDGKVARLAGGLLWFSQVEAITRDGATELVSVGTAGVADHIREGRLMALGVSHASRSPLAPDIPTIAESGYPGFTIETYHVMISPAAVSEPVVRLLERELQGALSRPDLIERFRLMDIVPLGLDGPGARQRIKDDTMRLVFQNEALRLPTSEFCISRSTTPGVWNR